MKEIGSEFWPSDTRGDVRYLLSGRTALELIARDIVEEYGIRTVYIPSYCCHTMIMPFVLNRYNIRFYDVYYKDGLTVNIPKPTEDAVLFFIRYFGYARLNGLEERNNFKVVIEDKTHSWLSSLSLESDYSFTSYKKWAAISGIAKAEKKDGKFISTACKSYIAFENMREQAFLAKRKYIETGVGDKREFLSLFNDAEELLEIDYADYAPSARSYERLMGLDTGRISIARKQNASTLIKELIKIPEITLINHELGQNDVPLCVPILISDVRNDLRKYLIANDIYLPIHWPISGFHKGISDRAKRLYNEELSVVCDQRYNEDDMERIINTMKEYFSR